MFCLKSSTVKTSAACTGPVMKILKKNPRTIVKVNDLMFIVLLLSNLTFDDWWLLFLRGLFCPCLAGWSPLFFQQYDLVVFINGCRIGVYFCKSSIVEKFNHKKGIVKKIFQSPGVNSEL
jgi:hypothetical protein